MNSGNRSILTHEDVQSMVWDNKYKVDDSMPILSRCIDGRYTNDSKPAALAIPGADAGDLGVVYAASNIYGFKIDPEKLINSIVDIIGGVENFSFHSDSQNHNGELMKGDGHFQQMTIDPDPYHIYNEQLDLILNQVKDLEKKGAKQTILDGNHQEGAVLMLDGDYGVLPQYKLVNDEGTRTIQTLQYHFSLANKRHRLLAKKLLENEAVELFPTLDKEYLYEVISTTSDDHFFETAKRLAKDLPIFHITFKDNGEFTVKDEGVV